MVCTESDNVVDGCREFFLRIKREEGRRVSRPYLRFGCPKANKALSAFVAQNPIGMYQRRIIHSRQNKGKPCGVFIIKRTDKAQVKPLV
jgi:hypothetical protein